MQKVFETTLENFNTKLWQYHVLIPEDIAQIYIEGDNKRVLCQIGGSPVFHAALMKSRDYWFVLVNKAIRDHIGVDEGGKVTVTLEKDHSEYGHEMPEELQVLLDQDDEGRHYFESLTKGKQRSLVYLVTQVKNSNSRLNKSLAIVDHLKEVKGILDFKQLNEKIKYYNNLGKHHW